jgi:hypothetical protein
MAQKKTAADLVTGSGFQQLLVMNCSAILASESQPSTRCLNANDGWHDGLRRDDASWEATLRRVLYLTAQPMSIRYGLK